MGARWRSVTCVASLLCIAGQAGSQVQPFEVAAPVTPRTRIDELLFARLAQLGIEPAFPASDAVFLRRVHLDLIGTLPTVEEARRFLADRDPGKRAKCIDALLDRPEFAEYQAMRWADLLRVKAEFPINLWPNAVQAYHRWIHASIAGRMPYDRFARELLTASGSCFRVPAVNFWRATQNRTPEGLAGVAALTFLGTRIERWPAERRAGMAAFFGRVGMKSTLEWKEEIVFFDRDRPPAQQGAAVFPDGTVAQLAPEVDPRVAFADWLVAPDNPFFARAVVNRIWAWLLGRGLVHEPDDQRPDNPPVHPDVLRWLERELVTAGFDLRPVYRAIANSQVYQLSALPRTPSPEAEAHFAHYGIRRLEAEVLLDAICRITGTTERYTSPIPEPFTFLPEDQRAIAIADGSITSPFLEMYGRPPRDTGLESERDNQPSAAQRLHLLNSSHVQNKIQSGPGLAALLRASRTPKDAVRNLYLAFLSRPPSDAELEVVTRHAQAGATLPRQAAEDLAWALLNSTEFLYRH
ncbi:MAG: DUF1553 domain-containing protein [Planctomycetes bacterium]|nr:DUF1553 domain-containing protein [Planctomycetota bacterium]